MEKTKYNIRPGQKYRTKAGIATVIEVGNLTIAAFTTWAGTRHFTLSEVYKLIEENDWERIQK